MNKTNNICHSLANTYSIQNISICNLGEIAFQFGRIYFPISPKLVCNFAQIGYYKK